MVIRAIPETLGQLEFLRELESFNVIDFWILPATIQQFADIRISPETYVFYTIIEHKIFSNAFFIHTFLFSVPRYASVIHKLTDLKINYKILIADLGQLEKQEQKNVALRRTLYNGNKAIDVENYHTYEEVKIICPLPRK